MAIRETLSFHSIAPDLMPPDAPLEVWSSVSNVAFHNGESRSINSDKEFFGGSTTYGRTITYVEPNDTGYWVLGNASGIYAYDGSATYDITPASWTGSTAGSTWTSTVINGLAVINCSARDPVYWDGNPANICVPLPDWPSGGRCLAMRAHKNFLFAIGMTSEGGQRVRWSDAAEAGVIPQEWSPTASNLAGFVDLSPMLSNCLDGMTLRDDFLIYKDQSIYAATFIGGSAVFSFRQMFAEAGIAGSNAVTRGPNDEHLFIGSTGDVYLTDGVNVQAVLDGRAQRFFYSDFQNPTDAVYSAVTLDREKMGILAYPKAGDSTGTTALLYDFPSGDISFRDMPNVNAMCSGRALEQVTSQNDWDNDSQTWNNDGTTWTNSISAGGTVNDVLMATTSKIYVMEGGELAQKASMEKAGLAFGNPQRRKTVVRLWPKVVGTEGDTITFRVGGQDTVGGPVTLGPSLTFTIGSEDPIDCFAQGRFITLLVDSKNTIEPWRIGTIDVEYRENGKW